MESKGKNEGWVSVNVKERKTNHSGGRQRKILFPSAAADTFFLISFTLSRQESKRSAGRDCCLFISFAQTLQVGGKHRLQN